MQQVVDPPALFRTHLPNPNRANLLGQTLGCSSLDLPRALSPTSISANGPKSRRVIKVLTRKVELCAAQEYPTILLVAEKLRDPEFGLFERCERRNVIAND